jgi:peptidoglycan/LPS O-acetylase OafA/YrhL
VDKVSRHGISGLTEWFNSFWLNPIDFKTIVNHIIFLGDYKNDSINFVIWSLIHEMRISIIFPFIFLLVKKTNWKLTIGLCFTLSIVYYFGEIALNKIDYNDRYFSSYERTIHYVGIFMFGSLLAKNRLLLINFCKRQNILVKIIFLIFAIMCYTYSWWFLPAVGIIHLEIFNDWVIAFGSSIFISLCLSLKTLQKILLLKPIHFLGNISYSLYLLHGIVLLATINILYGVISYWKILVLSFVISILSATLSYYFVEHPSIKLGRKLTNKNQLITSGNKKASA